jgi:hypothetical protein
VCGRILCTTSECAQIHTSLGELHGGMQRLDERQQELSASLYRVQPNANTSQQHWLGYVRTVFDVHICSGSQHSLEAWPSIAIMHLMAIDEMICQCIDGADAELPMAMCCDAVWLVTLCDAIRRWGLRVRSWLDVQLTVNFCAHAGRLAYLLVDQSSQRNTVHNCTASSQRNFRRTV